MTIKYDPKRGTVDMMVENLILNALEMNRAKTEFRFKSGVQENE